MSGRPVSRWLNLWLALSVWRQQPGALLAAVLSIAMGVALGLGINLVNRSALDEFDDALKRINGQAQYRLTGPDRQIDDAWLSRIEELDTVRAASPVIETELALSPQAGIGTQDRAALELTVIALDVFRAAAVAPAMLPRPFADAGGGAASALFADDAIFLSTAARQQLDAAGLTGNRLAALINGRPVSLRVAGTVPGATGRTPIAVMDIGAAQQQLQWLGRLSRIDLRLQDGVAADTVLSPFGEAAAGLRLVRPDEPATGMSNLSRAYRVNLNVLALVALLTGGFIVFAAMELAVLRMTPMLALTGVLGAPVGLRTRLVLGIALALGAVGASLGLATGIGLAWTLLRLVGGDLGGGYFPASAPPLSLTPGPLLLFGALGVGTAVLGALSPALKLRRLAPARALKSGQATLPGHHLPPGPLAAALVVAGLLLLLIPPVFELPLGAYLAIACWLFAGVLIVAPLLGLLAARLRNAGVGGRRPLAWLAIARLDSAHQSAFPALAGVVASFALVSAMAVMVFSFRVSVDDWLGAVLPADLYVRVPTAGARAGFGAQDQARLRALPGVTSATFLRQIDLSLAAGRPPVALLARPVDASDPSRSLPLTGTPLPDAGRRQDCIAIYPSEPAATVYRWQVGQQIALPLTPRPSAGNTGPPCFQIVAIWRDYARQHGAIVMSSADYQRLSGDTSVSNAALTLADGVSVAQASAAVQTALADFPGLQIRSAGDIRQLSLRIFDRSFAVTYALEAVALLVGLFGVATTYAGEALSRAREFGMMRHLGMTRRSLASLFALESGLAIGLGVLWGAALGAVIAQVLIHKVNPQSFHWTMQTHWPAGILLGGAAALLALGVLAAMIAARRAAGAAPIAAVRADW